ncbi:unnamed protein product [Caenorhabditis nigoni]
MKPDELNTKCSDSLYLIHANVRGCCELMEELSICQPGIRSKVHWKKHIRIFQYGNQRFAFEFEVIRYLKGGMNLESCMDTSRKTGIYGTISYRELINIYETDPRNTEYIFIDLPCTSRRPIPVPTFEDRYAEFGPDVLFFELTAMISSRLLFHGCKRGMWPALEKLFHDLLEESDSKEDNPFFMDTSEVEEVHEWWSSTLDKEFKKKQLKKSIRHTDH